MSRGDDGRFISGGKGGPGRPRGSRNKLGEEFVSAMYASFLEHGAEAIDRVRQEDPVAYIRVIASLLPRHFKIDDADDTKHLTDDELDDRIRQLAAFLGLKIEPAEPEASPNGSPSRKLRLKVH